MSPVYRIGADENGLGARLGPLVVTAVLARVDERGEKALKRRLPRSIAADLDDSKRLVSHGDVSLGEAWARALSKRDHESPESLFAELSLQNESALKAPCPSHVEAQCWSAHGEEFVAPSELLGRVQRHKLALFARGIEIVAVRSSVVCTKRLNQARGNGQNRFVVDLHSMESLLLSLRDECKESIDAICGKVGGIGEYSRFFGPLSGWLHAIIEESRARSAYHFPGLGKVCFERDADAKHPLVMLASLVGKYVRELLMSRVSRFYLDGAEVLPSGYHDPLTNNFVQSTELVRRRRRVPKTCFERQGGVIA